MKKYLLLPLVALGVLAWAPTHAKAAVHYPGYAYYNHHYWQYRHRYYHHRHWHRW